MAFTGKDYAMIHPVGSVSPNKILDALEHLNSSFPREEMLSNKVFLYDTAEKTFAVMEL